jgi:hypothetical protein
MAKCKKKTFVERPDRHPVKLHGFALGPGRDSDIRVANVSYAGCQIRCEDGFTVGEVVELRIVRRGAVQAEICWSADGRAGARFLEQF